MLILFLLTGPIKRIGKPGGILLREKPLPKEIRAIRWNQVLIAHADWAKRDGNRGEEIHRPGNRGDVQRL